MSGRTSWILFSGVTAGLATLALGAAAGAWHATRQQEKWRDELRAQATSAAVAFTTADVTRLSASPRDEASEDYRAVKRRLRSLRGSHPKVRFVYLFRTTETPGRVVFLADSEPPGAPAESKPGDDYPEALESPGLQSILRDRRPSTEGPLRDSFGEWITAYALVDPAAPAGAPLVVLGLDVDAGDWNRGWMIAAFSAAAFVWIALGLPLAGWLIAHRERRHSRDVRRLSTAIQQSHSGVVITTVDFLIDYVNDGCCAATGYRAEELIGRPAGVFFIEAANHPTRVALRAQLLAGDRWQGELAIRAQNGRTIPVRAVLTPARDGAGRIYSFVAVFDDISDAKLAELELRRARDQAESADRAKGEFLAVMSHELRTPLNGIIGFATLLQDTALSTEQKDYAETIQKSGEALLELTNELLDYSRIDAGRLSLDPQTCAPRQVVEEAVELLSARASEKHLDLFSAVSPDVPLYVLTDPGRLRQVLVNLIGNAIKFTPTGEVELGVDAVMLEPAGDHPQVRLEFTVRDTGIGIAVEQQDKLFQPFSQVDASTTRKYGGAGLGLAISRSIINLMGGDIAVESSRGAGAIFRFHIQARVLEPAVPLARLPARRVFVVAANPSARRHYATLLARWGLEVVSLEKLADCAGEKGGAAAALIDIPTKAATTWAELDPQALGGLPLIGFIALSVPPPERDALRKRFRAVLKKPVRDPLLHALLLEILPG